MNAFFFFTFYRKHLKFILNYVYMRGIDSATFFEPNPICSCYVCWSFEFFNTKNDRAHCPL